MDTGCLQERRNPKMVIRSPELTVDDLRIEAALRPTELARAAGISMPTWYRIERGTPVGEVFVRKVLRVLSERLGREIKIEDVEVAVLEDKK
jgi:DNA-binding XRE family transcriptional regulator